MSRTSHDFRARRTPPKSRTEDKQVRLSIGSIYKDFSQERALAIADKIVDLIERMNSE